MFKLIAKVKPWYFFFLAVIMLIYGSYFIGDDFFNVLYVIPAVLLLLWLISYIRRYRDMNAETISSASRMSWLVLTKDTLMKIVSIFVNIIFIGGVFGIIAFMHKLIYGGTIFPDTPRSLFFQIVMMLVLPYLIQSKLLKSSKNPIFHDIRKLVYFAFSALGIFAVLRFAGTYRSYEHSYYKDLFTITISLITTFIGYRLMDAEIDN